MAKKAASRKPAKWITVKLPASLARDIDREAPYLRVDHDGGAKISRDEAAHLLLVDAISSRLAARRFRPLKEQ
jgi:hypothetical protein